MDEENKTPEESLATEILHHLIVQNKRIFTALIVVLIMLFVSNMAWLFVFQSYDFASYEYQQDGEGQNNINNNIGGDVYNGSESPNPNEN